MHVSDGLGRGRGHGHDRDRDRDLGPSRPLRSDRLHHFHHYMSRAVKGQVGAVDGPREHRRSFPAYLFLLNRGTSPCPDPYPLMASPGPGLDLGPDPDPGVLDGVESSLSPPSRGWSFTLFDIVCLEVEQIEES